MRDYFQRSRAMAIVILVLLILMLLCTAPVSAGSINIEVNTDSLTMTLNPNSDNQNTDVFVKVSADTVGWTLGVRDNRAQNKPDTTDGYMTDWDGVNTWNSAIKLANKMRIQGASVTGATQEDEITLSYANQVLEIGTAAVIGTDITMTIKQPVAWTDPILTAPHTYRIVIEFIGTTPV